MNVGALALNQWTKLTFAVSLAIFAGVIGFIYVPSWMSTGKRIAPDEALHYETAVRNSFLAGIAILVGLAAVVVAYMWHRSLERRSRIFLDAFREISDSSASHQQGLALDRFLHALQLIQGAEESHSIKVGAMFVLDSIVQNERQLTTQLVEFLSASIRDASAEIQNETIKNESAPRTEQASSKANRETISSFEGPADIQSALTILGRLPSGRVSRLDLRGAKLVGVDLTGLNSSAVDDEAFGWPRRPLSPHTIQRTSLSNSWGPLQRLLRDDIDLPNDNEKFHSTK